MKKTLVLLSLVAAVSAFSQGQVNFNNKITAVALNAPVSYAAGGPVQPGLVASNATIHVMSGTADFNGTFARAALYGGPAGAAEDALQLITPAVGFRAAGSTAGYWHYGSSAVRLVPGTTAEGPARVQVRVWDTGGLNGIASYEDAIKEAQYYAGKSVLIDIAKTGGGTSLPANLGGNTGVAGEWGLVPFSITYVPEPSIIGLGILGAVAGLLVFRRRN